MNEELTLTSVSEQETEVTITTSDTASDTDTYIETGTGSTSWINLNSRSEDLEFIIPEMLTMNEAMQNKTFAEIHNQQILMLKALEGIQEQQVEVTNLYAKLDEIYTVQVYLLVVLIFYGAYKLFSGLFSQI